MLSMIDFLAIISYIRPRYTRFIAKATDRFCPVKEWDW